jgi:hypothetical protein
MNIKKIANAYFNQHIIAFHSGAIGGTMRGGNDITRYKQKQSESPPSKKAFKLLIAAPKVDETAPEMREISYAYQAFTDAGYDVEFVTLDGSPVQFSHSDLTDSVNRWFAEDKIAQRKANNTLEIQEVRPSRYVAIYFAGKNDTMMDNDWYRNLAEYILNNNGVVSGSGRAEDAVQKLNLSDRVEAGYSLPVSKSGTSNSEYGAVAAEIVKDDSTWMIHKDELLNPDTDKSTDIGKRMVDQLAS